MVKGVVQTLEATIGAVLILSTLVFLYSFQADTTEINLLDKADACLKYLDNKGELRYYAFNGVTTLETKVKDCLPGITDFDLKVCYTEQCNGDLPENKTVVLSSYIISGYDTVNPALINLWVWSKV